MVHHDAPLKSRGNPPPRPQTWVRRVLLPLLFVPISAVAAVPAIETFTYKTVGSLAIKADVHRPDARQVKRPTVVWLHGGSLINGKRESVAKAVLKDAFLAEGFIVVSVDYRLAPETKLPGIIEDVEDAFRWVREKGPALFGADPDRIIAHGGSAGGYLTLVTGYRVKPRPVVLVAEMSYGDLINAWHLRPSVHPPHYETNLSKEEAWRQVSGPPIANDQERRGNGSAFNDYIRRQAEWPQAISGWDPRREAEKYLPYLPVRNVTADYPPTILIHGREDTDVSREFPEAMAAELRRHGVDHRLILIPGAEHGYRGGDPADVAAAYREAVKFVREHLERLRR